MTVWVDLELQLTKWKGRLDSSPIGTPLSCLLNIVSISIEMTFSKPSRLLHAILLEIQCIHVYFLISRAIEAVCVEEFDTCMLCVHVRLLSLLFSVHCYVYTHVRV